MGFIEDSKAPKSNTVNVYDFKTKTVMPIPARELAADMVQVRIDGVEGAEGPVWVDAREMHAALQPAPIKHQTLSREMKADINEIRLALWEVRPMPKRDWEEGFQRDTNPDKEIALWLRLKSCVCGDFETIIRTP